MLRVLTDRRGMALLLVLAMVALLTALIVSFSADESLDLELAYNFRDSVQAQYIARGGVEAAISVLAEDNPSHDSLDEQWGQFGQYALSAAGHLEGGSIEASITDESGKIDLNALAKNDSYREQRIEQFVRLFALLHIDATDDEVREIAYAVIDWVDADNDTELGAEDDYYMSLDPPYHCKNAPMDSPEEILLVKGMKKEYFFGSPNYEGIQKYVTVGTNGKINVNTASEIVLMSLSDSATQSVAAGIEDCRPFLTSDLACITGLDLSGQGAESAWLRDTLTVRSSRFRVDVKAASASGAQIFVTAVLERVNNKPRIVYYRIH